MVINALSVIKWKLKIQFLCLLTYQATLDLPQLSMNMLTKCLQTKIALS